MNQTYSTYKRVEVNTANPLKLVLMLYDGAISYLKKALDHADKRDVKHRNIYANKARDIIVELNNSLNMEAGGEISQNLRRLYFFMDNHLMRANWSNDTQGLKEVMQLLENLREAWQDVYNQKVSLDHRTPPAQSLAIRV